MESYLDSRIESDKNGIVNMEIKDSDASSSTSSKFMTR